LGQARHDPDEDVLGRVLGVGPIPQHANGDAINVALQLSDELLEGSSIALESLAGEIFERRHRYPSISPFSLDSSERSVTRCVSSAPSTSSRGTGGAWSTKLCVAILHELESVRPLRQIARIANELEDPGRRRMNFDSLHIEQMHVTDAP
jgi:hypothetical protein